jgi:hypothetical protein
MLVDIGAFAKAVEAKQTGVFLEIGEIPDWLAYALLENICRAADQRPCARLSSDTAEAKLRKHPELGDLTSLLQLLADCFICEMIEVRASKFPNSIETYIINDNKIWLIAFKRTVIGEIVVSTAYRTSFRNLRKSRARNLLYGTELQEKSVDGRP